MTASPSRARDQTPSSSLKGPALAHPILFAVFPVVTLLGSNIEMTRPAEAVRPALVAAGVAALLVFGARLLWGNWGKAALASTLIVVAAYAIGQLRLQLAPPTTAPDGSGAEIAAFAVWVGVVGVGTLLLARSARLPVSLHAVLTVVAAAAIAQPMWVILSHEVQANQPWTLPGAASELAPYWPQPATGTPLPDIYYIVLDGYGRSDVLKELYGLDDTDFLHDLEARGFYIADQSRSNYGQTSLSFASALNMSYLNALTEIAGDDISQRQVARLIRFNEVSQVLEGLGYSVTAFSTGYRRAELAEADTFLVAHPAGVTPFEALLLESNAVWGLHALFDAAGRPLGYPGYDVYRQRIDANIQQLWEAPSRPGPQFVFAHLLLPHPPFVFDADGGPRRPDLPFRSADGDQFIGTADDYVQGYREQVLFAQRVVAVFLDRLAEAGGDSAVVILQGDHGPGLRLDWGDAEQTDTWERTSILNAYRAPGVPTRAWGSAITPVNTFRVLFNELFGASYPRLPDRSYFSSWRAPYSFIPVEGEGGAP